MSNPEKSQAGGDWLTGGGEMGKLVRTKDWSKTPLGSIDSWPQSLRTTVSLALASNFPISIAWGPQRTQIYNDGYWPICGDKHPHSMGQDFKECWYSAWPAIGEAFESAANGKTAFLVNQRMFLDRLGFLEETFFTFSFSPIRDESGGIGGLFHPVTELTQHTLAERRLRLLRELAERSGKTTSIDEAMRVIGDSIAAAELDVPFAILYQLEEDGNGARLAHCTGVKAGIPVTPPNISFDSSEPMIWPLQEGLETQSIVVNGLRQYFGGTPCGPYEESPDTAVVLRIILSGLAQPFGFLIAGVSSRRPLDGSYRTFFDLLAEAVANALNKARSYEEERKRAEALAELDRAKTAFFSNVSHEFRTPLTLMLGPLEDALGNVHGVLPSEAANAVGIAHRNSLRLLKLVNTLLDFSRIEAGRIQANYEPTDLAALTADLASVFRSAVERAGLRLIVNCPPLPEPIYIDCDMWEKIVLNLLSNAFKFTFQGEIEVSLKTGDQCTLHLHSGERNVEPSGIQDPAEPDPTRYVVLEVRDTGTGIPPEELPRIFDRFHRVQNSRGRSHEGSGIGLALVQQLVRLHGGVVRVESQIGRGSLFTISIPRGEGHLPADRINAARTLTSTAVRGEAYVEEALRWLPGTITTRERGETVISQGRSQQALPTSAGSPVATHGAQTEGRILLADDNADMREYVCRLLNQAGFDVEAVTNGEEALEIVGIQQPDLVLTDIMMPGLDGFGLLRALRSNSATADIPIILLSARAGEEARIEGMQAGADDYLTKPFSARELLARVESHVKLARLRRMTEEKLRESQSQLTAIIEQLPVGVGVLNVDGQFMIRNSHMRNIVSEVLPSTGQATVTRWRSLHAPNQPVPMDQWPGARALRGESIEPGMEFIYTDQQGMKHHQLVSAVPFRDGTGNVVGAITVVQDNTERKQAEQALRESEERFRAFTSATSDVIYRMSPDWRELRHCEGREFVADTLEPTSMWLEKYLHPDDQTYVMDTINRAIRTKSFFELEHRVIRADGTLGWTYSRAIPILNDQGEIIEWFGAAMDVTARKQAEQALFDSEERFRTLADNMSQLAWMADEQGSIFWFNQRWCDYTGTTLTEMQGWGWKKVLHPDHVDRVVEGLRGSWATGEPWEDTFPLRGKHGQYHWFLSHALPIRDAAGNIIRWFGTNTDITDLRDVQDALRQSEARLQTFSHQLEDLVDERTRDLIQSQERLRALATELNLAEQRERKRLATELHDHLQQLLVLGKLKLGQAKQSRQAFPTAMEVMQQVDDILSEALTYTSTLVAGLSPQVLRDHGLPEGLKWLAEDMKKRNLTVHVSLPQQLDPVLPDDQCILLYQSVRELLINASKYAGTREATVQLAQDETRLQITVHDKGIGFNPVAIETSAADANIPSTKFGLFSIRERMLSLGGSLSIESAPGCGTTAILMLPKAGAKGHRSEMGEKKAGQAITVNDQPTFRSTNSSSVKSLESRIRVLLVDDHAMVRQGLRSVLEGYEDVEVVGEAANGLEALQAVNRLIPHVVVMDINMPGMNGIEATNHLKAAYPDLNVIGLSMHTDGANQEAMKRAGAFLLIPKEAAVNQLYGTIQEAMRNSQSGPERVM
ncbi:response regulator [Candidatus Nitrospira neomarina]|uniref:Oxygen sensor histidine kinase NreB n=1 Tax=Candidatus Nitrospira neomarina TaxID=3020899 RepID=A0AA96GNG4_9BACT|nr:response regulator [Candidatus Nitrospira neomarina]WNM64112.1 response regulator [Candidatus Nitrospira neomarina]